MSAILEMLYRNWALVAIASTMVTLIVVPLLVLLKYVRIALNIMRSTRPPLARNPLDFEPLSGEPISFPAYDGLPLTGMLIRTQAAAPRGLIVFAHEFCSDMQSCARYCRPLVEAGYDILTFDFRGHGQTGDEPGYTPRQWLTDREVSDIRGAVAFALAWLADRGRPPEIGLFGISRGAGACILAAQENEAVRAIAVDGAFSTDLTIEYLMRRWAYIFATVKVYEAYPPGVWRLLRWMLMHAARREFRCRFPSVRKAIQRMRPRPMLFIHGEKDSYLPLEQSRRLYVLAGQPKHFWIAPGARHNQAVVLHPEAYASLTTRFFDRYLAFPRLSSSNPYDLEVNTPALPDNRAAAG